MVVRIFDNLNERTKELNCLYEVENLLRDSSRDLNDIFLEITEIIPKAWRYSDVCKARIIYNEDIYSSENFKRTTLKQSSPITIEDQVVGELQVFYIKPITNEKGIFLPDEQKLLNTIADKLAAFILLKRLKETVTQQQKEQSEGEIPDSQTSFMDYLMNIGLSSDEIEKMTRVKISFRKNETICKQGAISAYIMILAEGHIKAYLEGYQEKSLNFKIVKPYDLIGLTSLSGTQYYRFSASALTPCTLYLIEKDLFKDLLNKNQQFSNYIRDWYCNFSGQLFDRMHCIANKQAHGRVADVLHYLSNQIFESETIPSSISRKDIAELAGMSTESAVRILSEFKSDKIIKPLKNGIEILKPELIKTICMAG